MAALPPPAEAGGFLRRHFYERYRKSYVAGSGTGCTRKITQV